MNMNTIILIGLGGMIGAILRYVTSGLAQGNVSGFPLGTLVVNFTGTFALGTIMYLSEYSAGIQVETRIFLTIGILGAYTTMSTFGYESFKLIEQGENLRFALNLIVTNALVIIGVLAGKILAQRITGVMA